MIKSCEDIETVKEFREFSNLFFNTKRVGLEETARLITWSECYIVDLKTINNWEEVY